MMPAPQRQPESRLAISNIAWEPGENDAVRALLSREGVAGVEIAPTKWRDDPFDARPSEVAAYRASWEDRGLRVVSLQALLFGQPDLQLFDTVARRADMTDFLRRVIDFGAALGAHALVFGSPKNRLRGSLAVERAIDIATVFFREVGEHAHDQRLAVCIEANPPAYGCDFITTTAEAVNLCRLIDHPGIRVNGDLGGMTLSGEDPIRSLAAAAPFLSHFHASEPNLAELGASADHDTAERGLTAIGYDGWVSIEMRAAGASAGGNLQAIERAVRLARRAYSEAIKTR
ncbi:MAG: sugar phosphate isomerase/epimerase family protein [bacterium]